MPASSAETNESAAPVVAGSSNTLWAIRKSARPRQWIKNLFVLVPLAFARPDGPAAVGRVLAILVAFCFAASGLYLQNDIADRDRDRSHPKKRHRPIAAGTLAVSTAKAWSVGLLAAALALGAVAGWKALALLVAYVALTAAYSAGLKHVIVLDVMMIASGFLLRVAAGAFAAGLPPSEWLLVCTGFLALFLGFGKRRQELRVLGTDAAAHRPNLSGYTAALLDQFLVVSTTGAILAFAVYAITSPTGREHPALALGTPFVAYAMLRYLLLIQTTDLAGTPEEVLLSDRPIQIAVALWGLVCAVAVYSTS